MDDLIERVYKVPTGLKTAVLENNNPHGTSVAEEVTKDVQGFLFTREGLVRLLSEVKHTNKTIHRFLQDKHIKYL